MTCLHCGKDLPDRHRNDRKFCDRLCKGRAQARKDAAPKRAAHEDRLKGELPTCHQCSSQYLPSYGKPSQRFCSRKCRDRANAIRQALKDRLTGRMRYRDNRPAILERRRRQYLEDRERRRRQATNIARLAQLFNPA